MPTPHRIRRQAWTIRVSSEAAALEVRQRVRACWNDELLPAMERTLDALQVGDEVIHLGRIELRLRVEDPTRLEAELVEQLTQALTQRLQGALSQARSLQPPAGLAARQQTTTDEPELDLLTHFLLTGDLPWYAADEPPAIAHARLVALLGREPELAIAVLGRNPHTASIFRALSLLAPAQVADFLTRLVDQRVPQTHRPPAAGIRLTDLLTLLAEPDGRLSHTTRLRILASLVSATWGGTADHELSWWQERLTEAALPESVRFTLSPSDTGALELRQGATEVEPDTDPVQEHSRADEPGEGAHTPLDLMLEQLPARPRDQASRSGSRQADTMRALRVHHAGFVLLHPFFLAFLRGRNVLEGKAPARQRLPRAAALLHLLARDEGEQAEFELGLIKVLLGVEPTEPLLAGPDLIDDEDRDEADALLRAVIQHWTVLKRTSPSALRRTFLQRTGLLRHAEKGWHLHVEPASVDLLLHHLPWSVSVIRLPWMSEPIYTTWSTP